jgi:predicted regulator of Ras-like GTPase activity (Roadblock/LC7/MglB family)
MKWDDIINIIVELEKGFKFKDEKLEWIIVSKEGLPITSVLPKGVSETRIAAMTAALFSLAERSVIEMKKGKFDQINIKGKDGYLFVLRVDPDAVLTVSTKDVRLGLIFLDYCKQLGKFGKGVPIEKD